MDFNTLKDQVSNLTLYDVKAGVRKVQNAVMNYTEMEAKVREATNNEPWGASSTIMQEIANGTYNYSLLQEIMPMIYKRFTEKAAEEWRQIYKGLQLLEFLIKNGSERVIDDARSHLSLLKMLRQFHFIDQNGKDQGINVRNRAKELADLLSDVDRIRAERKKSRANRSKYGGIEGGAGGSMSGGGSRYGGFGSEDAGYGGYSGGVYGDGGGFGGNSGGFQDSSSRRDNFEEYDEGDDTATPATSRRKSSTVESSQTKARKAEPPEKKEPEVDLFDFGEDDMVPAPASTSTSNGKQPATSAPNADDDDDFDAFQSATPATLTSAQPSIQVPFTSSTFANRPPTPDPKPSPGTQGGNLNGLAGFTAISPAASNSTTRSSSSTLATPISSISIIQPQRPTNYQPTQPNYFTSVPLAPANPTSTTASFSNSLLSNQSSFINKPTGLSTASKTSSSGGDAFGSIWSSASAGIKKTNNPTTGGPNLASMAKEKASQGIWGATASTASAVPQQRTQTQGNVSRNSNGLDDLLG